MNWSDIKDVVGKFAPLVGTVLGVPGGAVMGTMLAKALGVENTPDAVAHAINSDPNAAIKLKQFEYENEKDLRDHSFKVLNAELGNISHAREVHKHSIMPMLICIALTLMVSGGAYMLFTMNVPADNKNIANLLFGTVLGQWGASIAYWVGTTRSSAEKSKLNFK